VHAARLAPPAGALHAGRADLAASPAGQPTPSGPESPAPSARAALVRGHATRVIARLGQDWLTDADREPEAGA